MLVAGQGVVAVLLGTGLSVGGFVRVWLSTHDMASATAITASLLMIVVVSILVGTILPYAMAKVKLDPAHAGALASPQCLPVPHGTGHMQLCRFLYRRQLATTHECVHNVLRLHKARSPA